AGRTAEVPLIRLERGDDELPLELPPGLLQGDTAADQLVHDLVQPSVEILLGQDPLLGGERRSSEHTTGPRPAGTGACEEEDATWRRCGRRRSSRSVTAGSWRPTTWSGPRGPRAHPKRPAAGPGGSCGRSCKCRPG